MGPHGGPGACDWLPYEAVDLEFVDNETLQWRVVAADFFPIYRGVIDGMAWEFNHDCLDVAVMLSPDNSSPPLKKAIELLIVQIALTSRNP